MPRNRVDELESTVRELESTVQGLTEELVESKERINVLEELLDAEPTTRVPDRRPTVRRQAEPDDVAAAGDTAEPSSTEEDEPQESGSDEIIVA